MTELMSVQAPRCSESSRASRSIRVGINCLDISSSFVGGVTTYALGLLEGFVNSGTNHRFRVFVTGANHHLFEGLAGQHNLELVIIDGRLFPLCKQLSRATLLFNSSLLFKSASDVLFEELRELMDSQADIIYTPTPVLRCFNNRKPSVLSMHDIQHVHHPEFFSWMRRLNRRITYGLSARHADYFQASSNYIKDDLLRYFPWLFPEQIEVIPSGVLVEKFATASNACSVLERHSIPERFLMFPAQLWPHKNHVTVLRALKQIEREHGLRIPLILTGEKFSAAADIFTFIAEHSMNYVQYLGKLSFDELVALYQHASFMITATLHESSSLPILEAAAAGTPIIASKIPPIEELGQVLKLNLFDSLDCSGLATLILSLWENGDKASAQAKHNRQAISLYSWQNTARKYLQLFDRIVVDS